MCRFGAGRRWGARSKNRRKGWSCLLYTSNPSLLSESGMEWGAVFLATIISAVIGTLIMGLVANVPYAQAPGKGLNELFVYTVCFTLGFTWQQALSMVFILSLIHILGKGGRIF